MENHSVRSLSAKEQGHNWDFKIWQHSGLGQRILSGDLTGLEEMSLSQEQVVAIREFLLQNSISVESGGYKV